MLPEYELRKVIDIAKKYKIKRLYLLGSALYKDNDEVNDYDFAVLDVPDGNFFKFYAELILALPKNVDLINLATEKMKFKKLIMEEGKVIYEQR
jgi:predicted nucleotidyltransferase